MLLIVIVGCAGDPPHVPTEQLGPVYIASDDGSGLVNIHAAFSMGEDAGFYRLTEDETLVAKIGDQTQTMALQAPYEQNQYHAAVTADPDADTRFAIELYRPTGELYTSTMGFPGRFEISSLPLSIARADTITISWSPPDSGMDVTNVILDGRPCIPVFENSDGDPATIMFRMTGNATSCPVTVGFFRDRDADPNPAFSEPGILQAEQSRVVSFMSTL
jgi:hypothetical protein